MTDSIHLFAAGSLKSAMSRIIADFQHISGVTITARFAAAGGLRERIEAGEHCNVFASANMNHPQRLYDGGKAESIFRFAGNIMCAVLRPGLVANSNNIQKLMELSGVRIGTSTPGNDPCGDYAMNILAKAGITPTSNKAVVVTGGSGEKVLRADGLSDYTAALSDVADVLLIYKTLAVRVCKEMSGVVVIDLPPELTESANYGITAIKPSTAAAADFIAFVLSDAGQAILTEYGFDPAHPIKSLDASCHLRAKII
jgi:molybdenum ABC transporter molybdate-binding protein